jgi:hypothetical protein
MYDRVEPDSLKRCQHVIPNQGQCTIEAVPGGTFCQIHGGGSQTHALKRRQLKNLQINLYNERLVELGHSADIKSLSDEIAVLRMMLETRLNRCREPNDILIHSGPISDLIMNIANVVEKCHKLEKSMGGLLDKAALIKFADLTVTAIGDIVKDPEVINKIADKLIGVINEIVGNTDSN